MHDFVSHDWIVGVLMLLNQLYQFAHEIAQKIVGKLSGGNLFASASMFSFQKRRRLNWQVTEWLRCRYRKLIMTRPAKTQSPPDPGPELVPFRLDIANRTQLAAQAAQLGIKRNVLARDLVIRALNEPAETTSLLLALNQQVFALREELTLIAEVVLTHGGKLSQKEAQKWVDENLKPAE